jgi:hypothetical protein
MTEPSAITVRRVDIDVAGIGARPEDSLVQQKGHLRS